MIDPAFGWVDRPEFPELSLGQADSLDLTIDLAQRRLGQAIYDVAQELNRSGSQCNPEALAERVREVRRRQEVVADIAGLQVAIGACGKS